MFKFLITGGAGFIGSAVVRRLINNSDYNVLNLDKLTYAGNLESLSLVENSKRYQFKQADICDENFLNVIFNNFQPDIVMHLAAESHVDRSIDSPAEFVHTNVIGTCKLLEASRIYWKSLLPDKKSRFRFHHVSTDEVYGDLRDRKNKFTEISSYDPSSPYSASKASSDHLVRAWFRTYNLPIVISNCSNNYGPYQFPEKFIPHMVLNALSGKSMPIYGDGSQIRDWLYVDDHAEALVKVALNGKTGETYNIGGNNEFRNIDIVKSICNLLEDLVPNKPFKIDRYEDLITYVKDRPGHDLRYSIDTSKIKRCLNWSPRENIESGLLKTVKWYVDNDTWWKRILSGQYKLNRMGL